MDEGTKWLKQNNNNNNNKKNQKNDWFIIALVIVHVGSAPRLR